MPSVRKSLEAIGVDQVDLLLIHWPSYQDAVPLEDYMNALAEAKAKGYARLIGVSNFTSRASRKELRTAGRRMRSRRTRSRSIPICKRRSCATSPRSNGLMLTAYQPLAKGEIADDPVLRKIAKEHDVDACRPSRSPS